MVKLLYNLIITYIEPLLKFAGIIITDTGCLQPLGAASDMVFQYNDRDLVIAKHDMHYQMIKDKKDLMEQFNPFIVARHMVFVANLILAHINEIDDIPKEVQKYFKKKSQLVYDEDIDDYIPKENLTTEELDNLKSDIRSKIEMKHTQSVNGAINTISIVYVDASGNPIKHIPPLASYVANEPIIATYGAILNLIKKYQTRFPLELMDTDVAVMSIIKGVERYYNEKKRSEPLQELTVKTIDFEDDNDEEKIEEASNVKYVDKRLLGTDEEVLYLGPWLKPKDIDIDNHNGIIYNNLILPKFVNVDTSDFGNLIEATKYDMIELSS